MCESDLLDATTEGSYMSLELPADVIILTYVWIDGSGENVRGKSKTLPFPRDKKLTVKDCPEWNFDGSSTGQATGLNSDIYLRPVAIFNDPFFRGKNKLVMCDTYDFEGNPLESNHRHESEKIMTKAASFKPMFGIEQEYQLLTKNGRPLGWPDKGFPGPQGPYYCAVGSNNVSGRAISNCHYIACLYAGLTVSGTNAEVMLGQWEYQIGPVEGIAMGDQLWISRYILCQIGENFGVVISLDPKVVSGNWNGSGAHCNYSTEKMRNAGGITHIEEAITRLSLRHHEHIKSYDPNDGKDNARRLTGLHETAPIDIFSSGVANRGASIRIPRNCYKDGCGYLEDRRPASNCDPYKVTAIIVESTCL